MADRRQAPTVGYSEWREVDVGLDHAGPTCGLRTLLLAHLSSHLCSEIPIKWRSTLKNAGATIHPGGRGVARMDVAAKDLVRLLP